MRAGMWSALLVLGAFKCLTAQKCVTSDIIKVQDIILVEKEEKGTSKGNLADQRFLTNPKGEIWVYLFNVIWIGPIIKIGTQDQSQMYELKIISENSFIWTLYWCVHDFSAEVIHPDVGDLNVLLLLVVLAVHSAVDHQTKWAKSRQVGYPRNGLLMNTKVL